MSEPTHKELALAGASVTLLVYPETAAQRAFWTCRAVREAHMRNAVEKARERYGAEAPMAWRDALGRLQEVGK